MADSKELKYLITVSPPQPDQLAPREGAETITTYRAVDLNSGPKKYVCDHALTFGQFLAEAGPPIIDAETVVCEACLDKFEAGGQEVRVHDGSSAPTYTYRFPKGA